ncbi:hypothetical protein ACWEJ6_50490 [Nonomuraea sp. NPDC004702]
MDPHYGAVAKIREAIHQLGRHGLTPTPSEVVAELPFGFWVSLIGRGNNHDQRLWRTTPYQAFPGYQGGRHAPHRELDFPRALRDKIARHTPIYHRHPHADHEAIMAMLGFIDAPLADLVARYSPVPATLARRPPLP